MQNKRTYIKPILESETFVPQNYIAACGDINKVYKFTCNADYIFDGGNVWEENGKEPGLQMSGDNQDKYLGLYHKCNATHEAPVTDEFVSGYLTGYLIPIPKNVIIWKGENNNNVHCISNIHMDQWETTKS